ncbi:MDR family oxidoreductase [Stomatohabitans albus]|uniref:MDR family oxidoreductase n=1 Tax=Stomatohabitans albus TaxID=3110766 RepID=UPI00300CBCC4
MARTIIIRQPASSTSPATPNLVELEDVNESFFMPGPVVIDVAYSTINYKDALVLTGQPRVVKAFPLVAGIDVVGVVQSSTDSRWKPGDRVVLNGTGLSETQHGGLAQRAVVSGDYLIRIPDQFSLAQAAAIGTAGYTAALSIARLQAAGLSSSNDRPVLVTGATGGVGSIAIMVLNALGHSVAALTGRATQYGAYLEGLGASQVIGRDELTNDGPPLQQTRWAGVLDTVGGTILHNALAQTIYGGTVTTCGLAASAALSTTVMPFILRGVTLAGIDSVMTAYPARIQAWTLLADTVDTAQLDKLTTTVPLSQAIDTAHELLDGKHHGRIIVDVNAL